MCSVVQMQGWCQHPVKQCRHSFISLQFDGYGTQACGSRCDMCTGESSKFNVLLNFEARLERGGSVAVEAASNRVMNNA
jgi:hypothetical protein